MCESHTVYHLCGHVKIKTIVQCADLIDKLIASGLPITCNRQVCQDNVSDNVHLFPDICDKCKATGVIGVVMKVPRMKLEVLKAWKQANVMPSVSSSKKIPSVKNGKTIQEDSGSNDIKELENFEAISLDGNPSISTSDSTNAPESLSRRSRASSATSNGTTPDLSQIKTRVVALRTRTERLLMKIRAQKPSTLVPSSK